MNIVRLILLFVLCMTVISGCKKEEPAQPSVPTESNVAAAADTQQTICPVMGNPINKDIFVEYEGRKVYFCCPACIEEFNKDPGKYIPKLPQFKK